MLNRIAKRIYLSFLKTKNDLINKEITYADALFNKLTKYFDADGMLKQPVVQEHMDVYLDTLSDDYEGRSFEVNVIMLYVKEKGNFKHIAVKDEFEAGMGQKLDRNGQHYIVIYGDREDKYDMSYFKDTFIHELMHMFDQMIDEDYYNDYYFGHPVEGFQDNEGIPYPGMYGDDDEVFDDKFAEYYTCKAERDQYIFDLMRSIEDYADMKKISYTDIVDTVKKALDNKKQLRKMADDFKRLKVNYSPLAFLYHLTFSDQKNGNKNDAVKILNEIYK